MSPLIPYAQAWRAAGGSSPSRRHLGMVEGTGSGARQARRQVNCMLCSADTVVQRPSTGEAHRTAPDLLDCVPVHIDRAVRLSSHANIRPQSI
jgi:hypothetical protein